MDTILVNCSKDKAKVNDENGRFLNEVSQGIVVNKGDRVSLEGIAVESTGVGTNVIEIPKELKGWKYQPNSFELEVCFYIHHNYEFTIQAPLSGAAPSNPVAIYPAGTAKYGYIDKASALPLILGADMPSYKSSDTIEPKPGMKFYVMGILDDTDPDNPGYYGGALPFEDFYKKTFSKMKLEVPVGYDSPQNIASSITTQLHKTEPNPLSLLSIATQTATSQGFESGANNPSTNYINPNFTLGNGATRIVKSNWTGNLLPGSDENQFYTCFAAGNPALWEYGSQAFSTIALKNMTHINAAATAPGYITDVYNVYDTPLNVGNTAIEISAGYIITTSLAWEWVNCDLVAEFIHSQKSYFGLPLNTAQMKQSPGNQHFRSLIQLGRVNDASPASALVSPCYLPASVNYDATPNKVDFECHSFFNQAEYDLAYLGVDAAGKGAVIGTDGLAGSPVLTNPINGLTYNASAVAKYMNCNFIPVLTDEATNEWNIGIIVNKTENNSVKPGGRCYCLFDLGFHNIINPCVYLVNDNKWFNAPATSLKANYNRAIQLGAPNASMAFDGDRGRFYLSDFHWNRRVGSGTSSDAVPEAENTIITLNHLATKFECPTQTIYPYLAYANCGIALENIGLYEKHTNVVNYLSGETYGVEYEPEDWKNCLMGRLGFDYNQLFSKYGRFDAIFNPLYYETSLPNFFPQNFPYPLTTNPELDSSQALGLSVNTHSLPMYDLNIEGDYEDINTTASSCQIFANNLPNKLVFPYWLIYSDIINGITFHSVEDGEQDNIIAVCNRAYISGDFAFSFATDYVFTATKDYVISGITTQILNPDLSPADVDDGTSVIYKIQKPIPMFQVNSSQANVPKNAVEYDKDEKRKGDSHREGHKRNPVIDRKDATHHK